MNNYILGVKLDTTTYADAASKIIGWAMVGESRRVYAANVHMLMEAYDSREFCDLVNSGDLVTPDGLPLVWALRYKGYNNQNRVYGPTLMLEILRVAATKGINVGFIGSTKEVLNQLTKKMEIYFPGLVVTANISPPFRSISDEEDQQIVDNIKKSGTRILFVGLGCPKQEFWIASHYDKIHAVMIGVGAAFAFHSGVIHQAPRWIQNMGLEWLFRLSQEPKRLWKRYAYANPRFVYLFSREIIKEKYGKRGNPLC
jgi:N-acetylglucosaminyldiphosphoundecaprenol N-acetyl-beta-D-mannosaminyltransferase